MHVPSHLLGDFMLGLFFPRKSRPLTLLYRRSSISTWVSASRGGLRSNIWSPCKMFTTAAKDGWRTCQVLFTSEAALCECAGGDLLLCRLWHVCLRLLPRELSRCFTKHVTGSCTVLRYFVLKCHRRHCVSSYRTPSIENATAWALLPVFLLLLIILIFDHKSILSKFRLGKVNKRQRAWEGFV